MGIPADGGHPWQGADAGDCAASPRSRELGRRWTQFIHATADIIGTGLPAGLPDEPVLAFFFAHDDIIVFVGRDLGRSRSRFPKVAPDYRLALRLFGCLLREHPASAGDVEGFMRQHRPMVDVRAVVTD